MREEIIFIPLLLPSANVWNTMHFGAKDKIKKKNAPIVSAMIKQQIKFNNIKPFTGKVIMEFQPYVGKTTSKKKNAKSTRSFDKVNYSPSIKFFEDCIVRSGLLIDDSNDYVLQHITNEVIIDRNIYGDGMIIVIKEVPDDYSKERTDFFYDKVLNQLDKVK